MATVKKLKSGNWNAVAYYKDPVTGKISRPSFTTSTKSEAMRMASEWESEKERTATPSNMTVGECIESYITAKEAVLSPATIRGYRKMQRNHFQAISNVKAKSLTDRDVQAFVSGLTHGHSPKTVRNIYALFSSSVGMMSNKHFNVTLPQKIPVMYNLPTDEDIKKLIAAANKYLRRAIVLAAVGTLREGEVSALKMPFSRPQALRRFHHARPRNL